MNPRSESSTTSPSLSLPIDKWLDLHAQLSARVTGVLLAWKADRDQSPAVLWDNRIDSGVRSQLWALRIQGQGWIAELETVERDAAEQVRAAREALARVMKAEAEDPEALADLALAQAEERCSQILAAEISASARVAKAMVLRPPATEADEHLGIFEITLRRVLVDTADSELHTVDLHG